MLLLIARIVIELLANSIGLAIAYWILQPDLTIDLIGFVIVVAIFSTVRFILAPLMMKLSFLYVRVLMGGCALVTIFLALLVTTFISSHLTITGATTWVFATLIVWLCGVVASLLLPLIIFKKTLDATRGGRPVTPLG
jgi:putative membrane protein